MNPDKESHGIRSVSADNVQTPSLDFREERKDGLAQVKTHNRRLVSSLQQRTCFVERGVFEVKLHATISYTAHTLF